MTTAHDRERERLQAMLRAALEQPPNERERWLDRACGSDAPLRDRATDLLRVVEEQTLQWQPGSGPSSGARSGADASGEAALAPGQTLGRYQIIDLLGAGGMGSVYRALDPSLGREVAIKALARAFRGDAASLRRFEREARVLAALSHPNIAAIYGFERLDGHPYLVLERVDGDTLAQRLARGPLPLQEALAVAVQVVEGLEEAHGKGVIHRDLKPSNVMLAPGGRAKLVDFGLAKTAGAPAAEQASAEPITATGAVLGTARYMSPEQIHGEEVDTRTDVWAFGCLLYEMLTGRAMFGGRSVPEVLAAVLRDDPDWTALPSEVPASVRRLLRRCLRRNPHARLQHIGDARLELLDAETEPPVAEASVVASGARRALRWGLAAAAVAAAVALVWLTTAWLRTPTSRLVRLSLDLPSNLRFATEFAAPFAIAPAGSPLVIEAQEGETRRLYVRGLGDLALRLLPGTEEARQPFFSSDGAWVAFFADRKLVKVPVGGGAALPIADVGGNPRGATWAADGTIVVAASQTSGLMRLSDRGGRPVALTTLDLARGEYSHRWPQVVPGTRWVLFTVGLEDASFDEARIEAVSLDTGERRAVLAGAGFAAYLSSGQLLFARGGRLHAIAFDVERLAVRGTPEVVLDAVHYDPRNGGSHFAVSACGVFAYTPGVPRSSDYYLGWLDREGQLTRAVDTPRPFRDPQVSPEGRRIATVVGTSTESDLWVIDGNSTFSRLSFGMAPHRPTWSPDGARITVGSEKSGRWRLLSYVADGAGEPIVLLESAYRVYPSSWSPDGRRLVFQESRSDTGWNLLMLDVDAAGRPAGKPEALASTPFNESSAAISPDGKWIAYESDEVDAIVQVYIRSFPAGAHKVRASTAGARMPRWGRNGELYFWSTAESRMHVGRLRANAQQLDVESVGPVWTPNPPVLPRLLITTSGARYDVRPSDGRFLVLETSADLTSPIYSRPVIVLDWAGGGR